MSLHLTKLSTARQTSRVVSRRVLDCVWEVCVVSARGHSLGPCQPLFTLSSHVVEREFAVLLASAFPAEHQLREGHEVRPGPCLVVGGDSCEHGGKPAGQDFLGGFRDLRAESDHEW